MCGMVGMTRTDLPITCHHVVPVTIACISMNGCSSLSQDAHLIPVTGRISPRLHTIPRYTQTVCAQ